MTKRNLAIITQDNQIYSLNRHLISTRRLVKDKSAVSTYTQGFDSTELPPYEYLIPVNFLNMMTYHTQLNGLKSIEFSPTNFESTSLYISYGGDIFSGRIAPEKTFDILSEEFNYIALVSTIILVILMVFFMKKFASRSLIYKLFHK